MQTFYPSSKVQCLTLAFLVSLTWGCGGEIARFQMPSGPIDSDFNEEDETGEMVDPADFNDSEITELPIDDPEDQNPPATGSACGNAVCDPNESDATCPDDCLPLPPPEFCGDGDCNGTETAQTCAQDCAVTTNPVYYPNRVALTDLGANYYRPVANGEAFQGGLYPNGSNTLPSDHLAAGIAAAQRVQPLAYNTNYNCGTPGTVGYRCPSNPVGPRVVMVSIGMSNTSHSFCATSPDTPTTCNSWTFMGRATSNANNPNPALRPDFPNLVLFNGASNMQTAPQWYPSVSNGGQPPTYSLPDSIVANQDASITNEYDRIRFNLNSRGLSEAQVQVAWVKLANGLWAGPPAPASLPSANAEAYRLTNQLGQVIRTLKQRYPNLQQVFLTSRIYAGYANTPLNPEPYAHEYGFSVKWVVQAQIDQMRNGGTVTDTRVGNLNYNSGTAPWVSWGPYLWADGTNPRGDGLIWERSDFFTGAAQLGDGTHPNQQGQGKVGAALLDFFSNSSVTRCWFMQSGVCQ